MAWQPERPSFLENGRATIVLTYENGSLIKAVTRGNGRDRGGDTANARAFSNIPLSIAYKGQLVLRGEAVITYSDFEKINSQIGDADAKYKNPRKSVQRLRTPAQQSDYSRKKCTF